MAAFNTILPLFSVEIIDEGLVKKDLNVVVTYALLTFLFAIAIFAIYILVEHTRLKGYHAIQTSLREKVLNKLLYVRCEYFNSKSATSVYQQMEEDIDAVASCFSAEFLLSLVQVFVALGTIPVLINMSWKLSLIMCLVVPIHLLLTLFFSKKGYGFAKRRVEAKNEYSSCVADIVSGMNTIRYFGISKHFRSVFLLKQKEIIKAQYKEELLQELNIRLMSLFTDFVVFIFYIIGGYLIAGEELTIGQFISFQTYSLIVIGFVEQLMNVVYGYFAIKPSVERFLTFLDEPDEITGTTKVDFNNCSFRFNNVSFSYEKGEEIFKYLDLVVPKGSRVAILGKNGSGKTTLISLLLRMYQPQSGEITLNDVNINSYNESYISLFAISPQKPYLFCDSIKNNICLYNEVTNEKLQKAIEFVGLTDLIEEKSFSYCVGQEGCELSGGQRQRISLARTLVSDAPIIILDEPEASIDSNFGVILERLMVDGYSGKTVLVITHNSELLPYMDDIYEFDEIKKTLKRIERE